MEHTGWIKLHRKLLEVGYFKNSKYIHLWIYLLLLANHNEHKFMWNEKVVLIKGGQLLTGRRELAEKTGISESTIEKILNFFEKEQQIEQQKTTKFRIITILNWKEYQQKEQQNNNRITTKEQQNNTYKNVKNIKNDKNISKEIVKLPNEDINKIINAFKETTGLLKMDGSEKQNRQYAWLSIKKFGSADNVIKFIKLAYQDNFHRANLSSIKYIYYNGIKLLTNAKEKVENPSYVKIK